MIHFLTSSAHRYTLRDLKHYSGVPAFRVWSYDKLFRSRRVPTGTWIFTDMDRLNFWELELAARIYRELRAAGMRVLNDPATVAQRLPLLQQLHAIGSNRFAVWPASDAATPDRYPVFLRTISAHRGVLSELLHTPEAVATAVSHAVATGYPLQDLMLVEYCAQPISEGIFAKFGALRCGERIVEAVAAHQRHWCAKYGELGAAPEGVYRAEVHRVRNTPHAAALMKAFSIVHIDYGRADYTVVDGEVQIYEINTNPMIPLMKSHPYAYRLESDAIWRKGIVAALQAVDTQGTRRNVRLDDTMLKLHRRKRLLRFGARWTP